MSKVMSLSSLHLQTSRNGFDLSSKQLLSAKTGELTVVKAIPTLPKDKFKIPLSHFSRTQPLGAPAYTRFREYVDVWFVPFQLMWKPAGYYLANLEGQQQKAASLTAAAAEYSSMPYFSLSSLIKGLYNNGAKNITDTFGFPTMPTMGRLCSYLGYPVSSHIPNFPNEKYPNGDIKPQWTGHESFDEQLSPFPAATYQKVYQDHFRFDVWEKTSPWTWNLDFVTPSTLNISTPIESLLANEMSSKNCLFTQRYVNFERDMFFGVFPDSQLGDEAVIGVGPSATPVKAYGGSSFLRTEHHSTTWSGKPLFSSQMPGDLSRYRVGGDGETANFYLDPLQVASLRESMGLGAATSQYNFSVLDLRVAQTLQRFREVLQTGSQDIKGRMKAIWNAEVPAYYSDLSYRVGGYSGDFAISPVTNTNLESETSEANMQATGSSLDNGCYVNFDAGDYGNLPGILLVTYYNRPLLEYSQTRASLATKLISRDDFANPAFDRLGMEQIHLLDLINTPEVYKKVKDVQLSNLFIGYAPRYIKWKTDIDEVKGLFRTPQYSPWTCNISNEWIEKYISVGGSPSNRFLVYDFNLFKVNPAYTNSLFKAQANGYVETDTFLINFGFNNNAVRSLDYNGMPY